MVINVLVVDDSLSMRKIVRDMIESDRRMKVIGEAENGKRAIEMATELKPDVIIMDILMPELDGLEALNYIMHNNPTPTVIMSALSQENKEITIKAILNGAVDFIAKPESTSIADLSKMRLDVIYKITVASRVDVNKFIVGPPPEYVTERAESIIPPEGEYKVIVIGASAGGPKSVLEILRQLPGDLPAAILVVQHMAMGFTNSFARHLNSESKLKIKEAQEGDEIQPGLVLVAPGDYHMEIKVNKNNDTIRNVIKLNQKTEICHVRPSVNPTMICAAKIFEERVLGIILTGMGHDGAEGIKTVKMKYGATIAEDMSSCLVKGMPRAAIESGYIDKIVPPSEIPLEIIKFVQEGKV